MKYLAIFCMVLVLSACVGGGRETIVPPGPNPPEVTPEPPKVTPDPPVIRICTNGAAGTDSPSSCRRGPWAISGINRIPLSAVKLTNKQMQQLFAIGDEPGGGGGPHGKRVGTTACNSYITECNPQEWAGIERTGAADPYSVSRRTGTTPFRFITYLEGNWEPGSWNRQEFQGVKIASFASVLGVNIQPQLVLGAATPFLTVQSAGNNGEDSVFFIGQMSNHWDNLQAAIRANKTLIVAGYAKEGGRYVRNPYSSGCKGVDSGCLWGRFDFPHSKGTSLTAPSVAAALASVLAVFPDTEPAELAKFAKACAKKKGEGIEQLLAKSGGVGVADFTCMGTVTAALNALPTNGRTTSTINGTGVSIGARDLMISFTSPTDPFRQRDTSHLFPHYQDGDFSLLGVKRAGNLFFSTAAGIRDDFYGYSNGHGAVTTTSLGVGYRNIHTSLTRQESTNGELIHRAVGYSLGIAATKGFALSAQTTLTIAARTDQFLKGRATIQYGDVILNKGAWSHQISLTGAHRFTDKKQMYLGTTIHAPQDGDTTHTVQVTYKHLY